MITNFLFVFYIIINIIWSNLSNIPQNHKQLMFINRKKNLNLYDILNIQGMTKKKLDRINHSLGTMPIGKPLAHCETQLLNFIVLQFL